MEFELVNLAEGRGLLAFYFLDGLQLLPRRFELPDQQIGDVILAVFGFEDEQVRHGRMSLSVLEILEVVAVQPIGIGLARFQCYLHNARFSVGLVSGLPK